MSDELSRQQQERLEELCQAIGSRSGWEVGKVRRSLVRATKALPNGQEVRITGHVSCWWDADAGTAGYSSEGSAQAALNFLLRLAIAGLE